MGQVWGLSGASRECLGGRWTRGSEAPGRGQRWGQRGRSSACPGEMVQGGQSPGDTWLTTPGKGWAEGLQKRQRRRRGRDRRPHLNKEAAVPLNPGTSPAQEEGRMPAEEG